MTVTIDGVDLLFSLPRELSDLVLQGWLDVKSLAAVDSSYCNRASRPALLHALASPPLVIDNMDDFERKYDSCYNFMHWIIVRRVRAKELYLIYSVQPRVVNYLKTWGSYVTSLKVKRTNFPASRDNSSEKFAEALQHCPNLTALDLGGSGVNKVVLEAVAKCTTLQVLRKREFGCNSDCTDVDLNSFGETLHLTTLELRRDEAFGAFLKMVNPVSVKLLHVVWSREHPPDNLLVKLRQCTILESLLVHGDGRFEDAHLLAMLAACPQIKYLNYSGRRLSVACAPVIAQTLTNLKCIQIGNCKWKNDLLLLLAEDRADSLEELDLDVHYPVTGQGLNNVLTKCQRLRSLRIGQIDEIQFDESLLRSLTTFVFTTDESASDILTRIEPYCHNVVRLGVVSNFVTEQDLSILSELSLPSLRQIDLFSANVVDGRVIQPIVGFKTATVDLAGLKAKHRGVRVRWNHNMSTANSYIPTTSLEALFAVPVVM